MYHVCRIWKGSEDAENEFYLQKAVFDTAGEWSSKGTKCNQPKKSIDPRISLILGLDTEGNVYYAVSQANNDSQMMAIFFQ